MSRRFDYGTSEGTLQLLHPRRHKRMVVPPLLTMLLALLCLAPFTGGWSLLPAAGLLTADVALVRRRMVRRSIPLGLFTLVAGRMRALGSLVYYLSYHLVRYYCIPLVAIALFVPWFWAVPLAVFLCAAGVDCAVKKPRLSFAGFAAVYLMEQVAYSAGVFWGCFKGRCFGSYRVVVYRQMEAA